MAARGRIRSISGWETRPLSEGWQLACAAPGQIDNPGALERATLEWHAATVPSTAASALRDAGRWSLDGAPRRFDADEWWYRSSFEADPAAGDSTWLCFDGLATIADVWLNGRLLLSSNGMFTAHERQLGAALQKNNDLLIRFRSLDATLKERRARPRWRAPMVENQQLRWFRTTLLGRTPGWSPPAAAVGPWRGIRLERRSGLQIDDVRLSASAAGRLEISCRLGGSRPGSARIVLTRDGETWSSELVGRAGNAAGVLDVPGVQRWWPHTHGEPALYEAQLRFGDIKVELGSIGFRDIALRTGDDDFAIAVNGASVYCRGACWTPPDPVTLRADAGEVERTMDLVRRAGMNMLRVGGMMVYEDDVFLDQCDRQGILLWQDFMFANMDYPADDAAFLQSAMEEASQVMASLQGRPSVAILCGNSEGEQQAAMWGAPRERWQQPLFHEHLPALARERMPSVPYWPSSAHAGAFPHQASAGTSSYYGVGAYLRPLDDARRAAVRFASECLAFANLPERRAMALQPGGYGAKVHDPQWKSRTPRDLGAGWDFDDVRDHYLAQLFRVNPAELRYAGHERYLELSRVVTGEVMAAVYAEWRRRRSVNRGGLIWFLRDLWAGAGWGVIDASGCPKPAWYYLRRALAPVALALTDEGGNGLAVHATNDGATDLSGELAVTLYRFGEVRVARGARAVTVPARSALELDAGTLFEEFLDLSYAYRFGPPSHDVVVATLTAAGGATLAEAFHFVPALPSAREMDIGLAAGLRPSDADTFELTVRTRRLAQSVHVDVDGFACDDNYFHLAPGAERRVRLRKLPAAQVEWPRGTIQALNAETAATLPAAP